MSEYPIYAYTMSDMEDTAEFGLGAKNIIRRLKTGAKVYPQKAASLVAEYPGRAVALLGGTTALGSGGLYAAHRIKKAKEKYRKSPKRRARAAVRRTGRAAGRLIESVAPKSVRKSKAYKKAKSRAKKLRYKDNRERIL